MQANIAIGLLETSSIAKGIEALDSMCKAAGVKPEVHQPISKGKYIIVISGPVGEVESALTDGIETAGNTVVMKNIIRNIHAGALAALNKKVKADKIEAVGIVETKEALPALFAADAAAKAAFVHVAEVNTGKGIGGKGYFTLTGSLDNVEAAVGAAAALLAPELLVNTEVIASPHADLATRLP